ncbi:hypothetical protein, partial [Pantoea sp.]|uniref:hypothetical protein n=1 Tax=Pantoea sp. TaxID=69393 RepID=UPI00289F4FEF
PETSASGGQRSIQLSYGRVAPLRMGILRICHDAVQRFFHKKTAFMTLCAFLALFAHYFHTLGRNLLKKSAISKIAAQVVAQIFHQL